MRDVDDCRDVVSCSACYRYRWILGHSVGVGVVRQLSDDYSVPNTCTVTLRLGDLAHCFNHPVLFLYRSSNQQQLSPKDVAAS